MLGDASGTDFELYEDEDDPGAFYCKGCWDEYENGPDGGAGDGDGGGSGGGNGDGTRGGATVKYLAMSMKDVLALSGIVPKSRKRQN